MKQAATLFLPLLFIVPELHLASAQPQQQLAATEQSALIIQEKTKTSKTQLPAESLFQLMAAEMALDREHPDVALANYIAAAKETQDAAVAARATQIALTVSSLEVAIEPAVIWAKAAPENLEAQITTAALYLRLDQVANAIPYLRQAEVQNPEEALQYYLLLYRQLQKKEDNTRVIQALQQLTEVEKTIPSAYLALGEIYLYNGEDKKSLALSESAFKMNPQATNAIQLYTEALLRNNGKEAAKQFIDKQASEYPDNSILKQYYAQFLLDNGFEKEAQEQVSQIVSNPKLTSDELLQFARISIQAGWYDLAEKILKRSSDIPESKDISYYFLARVSEMKNNTNQAIDQFQQVLTGPFHVLSQIRASVLLTDNKRYDEALTVLSRTQPNDDSDRKQILIAKIDVLNKSKRFKESLGLINDNLQLAHDDIDLLYARSLVADQLEQLDMAETDLKTILSIQPNHVDALNALGFMLANKTNRYDEAEKYLSYALKIAPNNASVLDSVGWLYYKMGKYPQSLETLKKAAKIMPDAEIAAHLGEVMWKMKDFEGAKQVWNEALEQHPKHENVIDTMKRVMKK
ncbi:tetratricopeptide repeat protein [Candidatus Berkiella aquae]|uniref:Tetratricopeptide repeat protein n=1 Tax=Candidatus Berkiella aquae TaxID=295108 RepID=A0A0Q9YTD9_9GAMM|nr:tetratricopeptide repeat protein [Candidatus Berkiella aquae]MCS5710697.1 tetratricopeptide repeat protein [Candidatus Berkiella aquae]